MALSKDPDMVNLPSWESLRNRKRPWWKNRFYYWIIRNTRWPEWKYRGRRTIGFFVRGWRGWANHDTWGLDYYLSGILADALRYLAYHHHGVPSQIADKYESVDAADVEWTAWLLDKANWFHWYFEDSDGTSDELGWISPTLSEDEKQRRIEAYYEKHRKFAEEVLPDFIKHFSSLWD